MPVQYLRRLTGHQREERADHHLGYTLSFVAGSINAGGFLAVGQYTSHMTGIVSGMADATALGHFSVAGAAFGAVISFITGAMTTAILTNWAAHRHLKSRYALSLLLEAGLLLLFGLAGAYFAELEKILAPITVLLLCFIMGVQNAVITKISGAVIRTTHVTGITTDIGIELGKLIYFNRSTTQQSLVLANRKKLKLHSRLLVFFLMGGIAGGLGFNHFGFVATLPLSFLLTILACIPIFDDVNDRLKFSNLS